jgi:hypothetical protein
MAKRYFYKKEQKVKGKVYYSFSYNLRKNQEPILDLIDFFNFISDNKYLSTIEALKNFFGNNPSKAKRIMKFMKEIEAIKEFWNQLENNKLLEEL